MNILALDMLVLVSFLHVPWPRSLGQFVHVWMVVVQLYQLNEMSQQESEHSDPVEQGYYAVLGEVGCTLHIVAAAVVVVAVAAFVVVAVVVAHNRLVVDKRDYRTVGGKPVVRPVHKLLEHRIEDHIATVDRNNSERHTRYAGGNPGHR